MISQQQAEAIFSVEHVYQCIGDLITAIDRANRNWQDQATNYRDFANVKSDLETLEAFALILKNCSLPSLKTNHIIAQHLEEF